MKETVNQENVTANEAESKVVEEKMFTQEEVNRIINKRFSDYKTLEAKAKKFDELEEANKTELQKANDKATALKAELDALKKANEIREIRAEVAKTQNVPAELLTADTKESCEEQAKSLLAFASAQQGYPTLKDSGEVNHAGAASTRDLFAAYVGNQL